MQKFLMMIGLLWLGCGGAALAADAVPAVAYFPILPLDAPEDAAPQLLPVAANHPFDGVHAGVTRAIIVIHDETRDANAALGAVSMLAGSLNPYTMIIAPQFLLPSDLARVAAHLPEQGRAFAAWQYTDWPVGGDSIATLPQKGISSFTVVDLLLMYLSDVKAFPDLDTIVIAGSGAGAGFVQRYAAFGVAADAIKTITIRYAVAGAPSYLYLTGNRPLGGRKGFGVPDITACPDYNAYPFGLDKLNNYTRRVGANAAKTAYVARRIAYLNANAADALPEASCAAIAQGADSYARAQNYQAYLNSLFGGSAAQTQIFAPPAAKTDAIGLFGTACGMAVLFGDGRCPDAAMAQLRGAQ